MFDALYINILLYIKLGRSHLNISIEKIYIDYIFIFQMIIKKNNFLYVIHIILTFYRFFMKF